MKIRNGFVSNSSSSSFVVDMNDATAEQRKELREFGFEMNQIELTHSVICNQDDVILFLAKRKIPFKASIHYGCQSIFFDGERMMIVPNIGTEYEIYRKFNKKARISRKVHAEIVKKNATDCQILNFREIIERFK